VWVRFPMAKWRVLVRSAALTLAAQNSKRLKKAHGGTINPWL